MPTEVHEFMFMSHLKIFFQSLNPNFLRSLLCVPLLLATQLTGNAASPDSSVPQWDRFEKNFQSSASYENPAQEASLAAVFISPSGETNRIYGFWDGASTWRIRFSPNKTG